MSRGGREAEPLVCPACAASHPADERFCRDCGMPLTLSREDEVDDSRSEAQRRARKVNPAFTEGELVCVAGARHIAEAELIQGLLLEHGVPSMVRRTAGFDVPDFLAAGPRDVLVPASGAHVARDVLSATEHAPRETTTEQTPALRRLIALTLAVLLAGGGTAFVAWLAQGSG